MVDLRVIELDMVGVVVLFRERERERSVDHRRIGVEYAVAVEDQLAFAQLRRLVHPRMIDGRIEILEKLTMDFVEHKRRERKGVSLEDLHDSATHRICLVLGIVVVAGCGGRGGYRLLTVVDLDQLAHFGSGLLALDWWNGNRSVLVNADLSGMIVGLTLSTKIAEIYRTLIEATAFGTRRIIDAFTSAGLEINEIIACGGLSQKSSTVMQIYADVLGMEIKISANAQTIALGAAMYGAVAAGRKNGGYDDIFEAAEKMSQLSEKVYRPNPQHVVIYNKLYEEYKTLHDYFGRGINECMKNLKEIKNNSMEVLL